MKERSRTAVRQKKILKFHKDENTLLRAAEKRLDDGEFLSALRFLNSYHEQCPPNADSAAAQADAYELSEACAQALKAWYVFLDCCDEDSLADAYEGLAVNYMNLGKDTQAAYYYNRLLQVDGDISEESKMEIVETFSKPKKSPFRIVYPPERADFSDTIEEGLERLKEGKCELSREIFSRVPVRSQQYRSAQNLIAVSYLLGDDAPMAAAACERLLGEDDKDVQAYTTYAAALGQLGRTDEAFAVAEKISRFSVDDTDELYKIATVCCENGLHERALEKFIQLEDSVPNDKMLLYFKAVSAAKSGKEELSIDTFERLLTIYPEASVARYYYDLLRYYRGNRDKEDLYPPELSYYYALPAAVKEKYCQLLCFLEKLRSDLTDEVGDDPQVLNVLRWCFDENEGTGPELQHLAVLVAVRCRAERFLRSMFLNPEVSDAIKLFAVEKLTERNREASYGIVICHFYRPVRIRHINIGVRKHRRFVQGYARAYAKAVILSEYQSQQVAAKAEFLYQSMLEADLLSLTDRPEDVAAVIYRLSGLRGGISMKAEEIFDADEKNVEKIMQAVKEKSERMEAERSSRFYDERE